MKEQLRYARWIDVGTRAGFVVLIASFLAYVLGLLEPLVRLADLPRLWTLPVDRYIAASGAPTGWGWVAQLGRGDYLNLVGVATLCFVTVVAYARIVPALLRSGDRVYAWLAIAQIVVLLIAASGFLAGHG